MKRLCIITLAILCFGMYQHSYAEIRNGYDNLLKAAQIKMDNLHAIANEDLNNEQRKRLKKWLKAVHKIAKKLRENQTITQALIEKFRTIDPDLYHDINTIHNAEGNETDVYIKVVEYLGPGLEGATNVAHSTDNPHVYTSEYGDHSVSVKIADMNPIRTLRTLVHELGHVRYQVPHLAEYTIYYKQAYQDSHRIGHHDKDPSHQSVKATMQAFIDSWRENNTARKDEYRKMLAFIKKD